MKQLMKTLMMLMITGLIGLAWHQDSQAGYIMADSSVLMAVSNSGGNDDATCTSEFPKGENSEGLLTQIIDYIKEIIDQATADLYNGIINHPSFQSALGAAFTLFITLFGVLFIFGIVPLTLGQAATRLFKFAIILALIKEGFAFFNEYAIEFFNRGTDELIDAVIGIATGDSSGVSVSENGNPQPFKKLEGVVQKVLSSKNMVTIIGSALTGPMGPPMGGILAMGTMAFVQAIVKALRIYCLSLVAKALLFGMAPIFMSFMMFERTKHMFSGWTNQLVNYSLQPLFMFAFISFFIILMESAIDNILGVEFCWTEFDHWEGAASARAVWRPKNEEGKITSSDFTWQGFADCLAKGGNCKDFPISIIDMLAFLILAHLAYKFSDVVTLIATEIASSTLFLDKIRGGMGEYFKSFGNNKGTPRPTKRS